MKIKNNNPDEFYRVGNAFPTISSIEKLFSNKSLLNLLKKISNDDENSFYVNYLFSHSLKTLSNTVKRTMDMYGLEKITDSNGDYYIPSTEVTDILSDLIYARFGRKWDKLYETLHIEYDAIRPYDMIVNDDLSRVKTTTKNSNSSSTGSSSSNTSDNVVDDVTDNSLYGFNSVNPVPTDKSKNTSSSNSKASSSNQNTNNNVSNGEETDTDNREIKRLGNIGNTSQQELIEKERDVWKYQLYDVMFSDIDKVLTISAYL